MTNEGAVSTTNNSMVVWVQLGGLGVNRLFGGNTSFVLLLVVSNYFYITIVGCLKDILYGRPCGGKSSGRYMAE